MKNFILVSLALALIFSGISQTNHRTYNNPEIGLSFNYPVTWKILSKTGLKDSIDRASKKGIIPEETAKIKTEVIPSIVFSLSKPRKVDGKNRNTSINVIVMEIPEKELALFNLNTVAEKQKADIKAAIKGSETSENAPPLHGYPEVSNYTVKATIRDYDFTQHHYLYLYGPYFVQIALSYSHQDDEAEIIKIIESIKVKNAASD